MRSDNAENLPELSVAIIGLAGQFPDAEDVSTFWQNLVNGHKGIHFFSDEELLAAGVNAELLANPNYVKASTLVRDIDLFDAGFFGFAPREAEIMDPQIRLFLQCAWIALEDAGYPPDTYHGLTGVFAGKFPSLYMYSNLLFDPTVTESVGNLQLFTGNDQDALAPMVAYKLNLCGPSVSVQTFCSTSLVAVHLACQSLLNHECDIALAGGVAIEIPQGKGYLYQEGGILSPDGECRTFDAGANGSVMGNGLGVVVLKRLEEAAEDGDHIYAMIRGSATGNDGIERAGFTAPSVNGQAAVIATALANAGVEARTIDYYEAHGTGTTLGDSVELRALAKAFQVNGDGNHACTIGSLKPNIGHLNRAAGVAGLIKTALALHYRLLPPSLNFEKPNPDIDWDHSPFHVNTRLTRWESQGHHPRRAGVSSFGLGGTNAHVILEEAPPAEPSTASRSHQLLLLSAKTQGALEIASSNLAAYLRTSEAACLPDIAFTLKVGRTAFNHRRIVVCDSPEEGAEALMRGDPERVLTMHQTFRNRPVALFFPCAAEAYVGMAKDLYQTEPVLREWVDRLCELCSPLLGCDLRAALWGNGDQIAHARQLPEALAEPAVFVIEYALAQLLAVWGIKPAAMAGSGASQYVATCLAGGLSLEDALTRVVRRAESSQWSQPNDALSAAVAQLLEKREQVLLEVGPGMGLESAIDHQTAYGDLNSRSLPTLPRTGEAQSDGACLIKTLGRLWLEGVEIDWSGFYRDERRHRVSLPTYPFERQRYWIEAKQDAFARTSKPLAGKKRDVGDWFYQPVWKQSRSWKPSEARVLEPKGENWLLFLDRQGCGAAIAERLRQAGCAVACVQPGKQFAQLDTNTYSLNPGQAEDYRRLLNALPCSPSHLVHLWSVDPLLPAGSPVERFAHAQELGFYSLIYMIQALGQHSKELTIWAVTRDAQPVTGTEILCPEHAPILGACRVIPQENLNVTCHGVDITGELDDERQRRWLAEQLLAEFIQKPDELLVAFRGDTRWKLTYEPIYLPAPEQPVLRQNGVYWIIGGLGAVGMILTRHLAESAQARVILTGRSAFPAYEEWQEWLGAHPEQDPISAKIRQFQAWEAQGAKIVVMPGDVADKMQMSVVITQIQARFGQLNGVFHLAGISDEHFFGTMENISPAQCEAHFRPKVHGLYVLEQMLAGKELDFCLLFSSLSSILGGLMLGPYAAAHSFMDVFAQQHNRRHEQWWQVLNWDEWRTRERQAWGTTVADFSLEPAEAMQVFERTIANGPLGQIVNSTADLEARFEQWVRLASVHGDEGKQQPAALHPRPELLVPYVAPTNPVEERIVRIWQDLLGIEPIGIDDSFLELGGNSLIAIQVSSRLRQAFQVNLTLSDMLMARTPVELAIAVQLAIIDDLEKMKA